MKSFTVRDLDRTPAKVLAAADRDGLARVRSRSGRLYVLRPERIKTEKLPTWAAFAQNRRIGMQTLFPHGPVVSATQERTFGHLLSSDGTLL